MLPDSGSLRASRPSDQVLRSDLAPALTKEDFPHRHLSETHLLQDSGLCELIVRARRDAPGCFCFFVFLRVDDARSYSGGVCVILSCEP